MKTIALLLALIATACASNNDFEGANEVETCQPGSDIELQIGTGGETASLDGRVTVLVEVANNSDHPFTVESVRIDAQSTTEQSQYAVEGGQRAFTQEIADGADATFEIPITVRSRNTMLDRVSPRGVSVPVQVAVTVKLTGGDSARCRFVLPVRF
jgi:hypothetical protein